MDSYTARVRRDFDRLARVSDHADEAGPYHRFLVACLPERIGCALELGCGAGGFSRLLAKRAARVVAIDLSPEMIAVARQRSLGLGNLEYVVADAAAWPLPRARFDCVVSIATLHHLPFEATLAALAASLAPGGRLLLHDLFRDQGLFDRLLSAFALAASLPTRRRTSGAARAAWAEHAKSDRFLTMREVRQRAAAILPGARITRHLRWRYSIVWQRPQSDGASPIGQLTPVPPRPQ